MLPLVIRRTVMFERSARMTFDGDAQANDFLSSYSQAVASTLTFLVGFLTKITLFHFLIKLKPFGRYAVR